ncbi:MAG: ABC transporter substrate-binding protein [Ruminococcus sp.]|nr:ABC transporter substrate-binding protein [Ruminococcus sp.]
MKRILSLLLAVCLIASCTALLSACDSKTNSKNFPVTVAGTEIKEEPKRVVVLNDAFADIIMYMSYETKLVGRSVDCDQLTLNVLTSVGNASDPALDTLESLNPDLVISDNTLSDKARNKLDEAGIPIVTLVPATTQDEIKQLYCDLGSALGGKEDGLKKGEESYEKLFNLLKDYSTTTSEIAVTDAYLYLDEMGNYCTFAKGTVEQMIFNYNGAINVFSSKETPVFHATETTDENGNVTAADEQYIRYASPTYLFLDGTVAKDGTITSAVYDKLLNDPQLSGLTAIKEGRVSFIPRRSFYRPGVSFEETLFSMIDTLNKDEAAAEEASANSTEAATEAPTAAPTAAPTKAAVTEAPADEEVDQEVDYDESVDNGDVNAVDSNAYDENIYN